MSWLLSGVAFLCGIIVFINIFGLTNLISILNLLLNIILLGIFCSFIIYFGKTISLKNIKKGDYFGK